MVAIIPTYGNIFFLLVRRNLGMSMKYRIFAEKSEE